MKVLIFQLDGELPNIALMRIAAHHRALGDEVEFRGRHSARRELWDNPERVYASAIFDKTRPRVEQLLRDFPDAIVGGTGVDVASSLESMGITTLEQDYSIYPDFTASIGFLQRGCRKRCPFCVVPRKEGAVRGEQSVYNLWRGEPWPRHLHLLDNDFFGNPEWRERIQEINEGRFKVCFSQGINARFLSDEHADADEAAAALASVDYRDKRFVARRLYTAWDNRKDEDTLFQGLHRLVKYGVKPGNIMVYMLIGYWKGETWDDRIYRQSKLREFGCDPYPMPYLRTRELVKFQTWVCSAFDKRVSWWDWQRANYDPYKLGLKGYGDDHPEFVGCTDD